MIFEKYSFTCNTASEWVFLKENAFAFLSQNFLEFLFPPAPHNGRNASRIQYVL